VRERALIHVSGPVGAGKTTFIERLLGTDIALALCTKKNPLTSSHFWCRSVPFDAEFSFH